MIRNIYCNTGCGSKQGFVNIDPGTPDDIVARRLSGYLCDSCAAKVEIGGLLTNGRSEAAERMRAFAMQWDGKPITQEGFKELFSIVGMK